MLSLLSKTPRPHSVYFGFALPLLFQKSHNSTRVPSFSFPPFSMSDGNNTVDNVRDDNLVDFDLQPGVLSAIAFVTLEAIAIGLIDYATGRVLSWYYYRMLAKGQKITLQEANVPGVTRYQIGRRFAIHNIFATLVKIVVLAIIFYINLSITSRTIRRETYPIEMSTFVMSSSDDAWDRDRNYTVRREYDESRSCYERNDDEITFFPIVFNLTNNVVLENDDQHPNQNSSQYYFVNVSTIICANPQNMIDPKPLAKIVGCSRKVSGGCRNSTDVVVPTNSTDNVLWISNGDSKISSGERFYNVTIFDPDDVQKWFPEYTKNETSFNCLSYYVGSIQDEQRRNTECLLVYRPGKQTMVEKWRLYYDSSLDDLIFFLHQPGPVFEGDISFGEGVLFSVLRIVDSDRFSRDDYVKLGANLVALSSEFVGRTKVYLPEEKTVSSMPVVAIGFAFAIFTGAIFASVLVIIAVMRDSRPRFNTIYGLSSVMRHHFLKAKDERNTLTEQRQHPIIGVENDEAHAVFVTLPQEIVSRITPLDKNIRK